MKWIITVRLIISKWGVMMKQWISSLAASDSNKNLSISPWMIKKPEIVFPHQTLSEAAQILLDKRINYLPVVDENRYLIGLISRSRIMRILMEQQPLNQTVNNVMIKDPVTVSSETSILEAYQIQVSCLPVVNNHGQLEGLLTRQALMEAYNYYIQQLQSKEYTAEILNIVLESAYEGICVVDRQAIIREFNSAYSRFLGVRQEDVIGRKVTDVIENTRLHIVLETGVPERGFIQKINGQDMVVHRIPIWKNQQVVGAIGMLIFEGVSEVYHILQRVQNLYVSKHTDTENRVEKSVAFPLVKKDRVTFDQIIGNSECLQKVKRIARRAAKVASTVLITGESGTGKELFAKAIHYNSVYANGPFISVNCSAIPEHLLESELFGYEDGAFTGAKKGGKPGKFEQANKGTIFLDEIGDMPLSMQAKILRVLQERTVERVGGTHSISLDIRVIAATNANLQELVKQGKFRADLFYRLNIIPIHLPPLRDRKEDIPKLISYSLEQLSIKNGVTPKQFHQGTIKKMMEYDWPGNVRELLNTVEMLLVLCESEVITPHDLPEKFFESTNVQKIESHTHVLKEVPMKNMMEQHEYELIIQTLAECNGNKAKAARKLGIHRSTLYEKLKKYQLL